MFSWLPLILTCIIQTAMSSIICYFFYFSFMKSWHLRDVWSVRGDCKNLCDWGWLTWRVWLTALFLCTPCGNTPRGQHETPFLCHIIQQFHCSEVDYCFFMIFFDYVTVYWFIIKKFHIKFALSFKKLWPQNARFELCSLKFLVWYGVGCFCIIVATLTSWSSSWC